MLTSAKKVLANFLKNGWKSNFGPAIFEKFKIFPIFYTKFEIFGGGGTTRKIWRQISRKICTDHNLPEGNKSKISRHI